MVFCLTKLKLLTIKFYVVNCEWRAQVNNHMNCTMSFCNTLNLLLKISQLCQKKTPLFFAERGGLYVNWSGFTSTGQVSLVRSDGGIWNKFLLQIYIVNIARLLLGSSLATFLLLCCGCESWMKVLSTSLKSRSNLFYVVAAVMSLITLSPTPQLKLQVRLWFCEKGIE